MGNSELKRRYTPVEISTNPLVDLEFGWLETTDRAGAESAFKKWRLWQKWARNLIGLFGQFDDFQNLAPGNDHAATLQFINRQVNLVWPPTRGRRRTARISLVPHQRRDGKGLILAFQPLITKAAAPPETILGTVRNVNVWLDAAGTIEIIGISHQLWGSMRLVETCLSETPGGQLVLEQKVRMATYCPLPKSGLVVLDDNQIYEAVVEPGGLIRGRCRFSDGWSLPIGADGNDLSRNWSDFPGIDFSLPELLAAADNILNLKTALEFEQKRKVYTIPRD